MSLPDSKQARGLLEDLVRAYSPSGREEPAATVLAEHLAGMGLVVHRDDVGNVHARLPDPPAGAPTVLSLGHLDTVPGELPVAWEDGVLAGRGAVDAKGPLAAHALGLSLLATDPPVDARLVAAVGEETDSCGTRHLVETHEPPDALLVAEPTGLDTVGLGYKGRVQLTLRAASQPAHAGAPEPTAAERLIDAIDALTAWTKNSERAVGVDERTLRVTELASHQEPTSDRARARLDLRLPGAVPDEDELARLLGDELELAIEEQVPAVRGDPRGRLATALRGALIGAGFEPRMSVKTGTSDWNHAGPAWGHPPAVAYGPGDPALDHTPRERVPLDDVRQAARVLADGITRFAARG